MRQYMSHDVIVQLNMYAADSWVVLLIRFMRDSVKSNPAHLFSPLNHSNVGEGTAAASHLSRAVRPGTTPWLFISWMLGATGENREMRNVGMLHTTVLKKNPKTSVLSPAQGLKEIT